MAAFANAAQPVEPKVVGLMFWADTCASCKVLDPKIHAVKGECVEQPILFATFDHSNDAKSKGVVRLRADWTRQDPEIARVLERYGRQSVPLKLYFNARSEPAILPELLTREAVLSTLGVRL